MFKHLLSMVVIGFCFLGLVACSPVEADYQTAYNDYVYNLQQYKTAHNNYLIAKSTYQTYKTLVAQNDAIAKFKAVLKARNQLISAHFDLLQEKQNSTDGVTSDTKNTFASIRTSEKGWLSANQATIDAAGSLDDLNDVSKEFETKYPQMDRETKQAIGAILIAKENSLRARLNVQIAAVSGKLGELQTQGENTAAADRGLISVQSKLDFQTQKVAAAQEIFADKKQINQNRPLELLKGQKSLIEANAYLKEAAGYLLEIVRSYTG